LGSLRVQEVPRTEKFLVPKKLKTKNIPNDLLPFFINFTASAHVVSQKFLPPWFENQM